MSMSKATSFTMLALVASLFAYSQTSYDFGKVSMNELSMTSYPQDTSARAVIIFNNGDVVLDTELNASMKRHVRIKFFDQSQVDDWANMTVRLSRGGSSIAKVRASSFNLENGKMVESKMAEDAIFKTKLNRYYEEVKFAVPNVKAGTVIDISYTIRASASAMPSWQFQFTIPVMETRYEASIPGYYVFRQDVIGYLQPSRTKEKTSDVWTMKDVPAFKKEPYMTTTDDFISRIDFHLSEVQVPGRQTIYVLKDWGNVVSGLLEESDFGGQMRGSNYLNKIVEAEVGAETDPDKIVEKLFNYVKANVEWNEYTDVIPDHLFKKVLEDKKGSSSEINLLLITLLQKAGLKAEPIALSTRDYGAVRAFVPKLSQFNDLICSVIVKEKRQLLDATDRFLPMKSLPQRCLTDVGLVINEKNPEWITIQSSRSRMAVTTFVKINEAGELAGEIKIDRTGLAASNSRSSYRSKGEEDYVKALFAGKSWQVDKSTFENKIEGEKAFTESHQISIADHIQDAGDRIYLNPLVYGMQEENPFKSEKREYPIDFGTTFEDIIMSKVEIPADYEIEEMPQPKAFALPAGAGRFTYSSNLSGKVLTITCQLVISKNKFTPEEYGILREFYTQVVAKEAEQVVLKKKS